MSIKNPESDNYLKRFIKTLKIKYNVEYNDFKDPKKWKYAGSNCDNYFKVLFPNDDYPDSAILVANGISSSDFDKGIIICGSGVGASIAANKVKGVRAAVCHDLYSAVQGVEHDDMNVLCLGSKIIDFDLAIELVKRFISAQFSNEDRFHRRLRKVIKIENDFKK